MTRHCPKCDASLDALQTRCGECGHVLPESQDRRSQPESPQCGVCSAAIALMTQTCPACGATGYPALRPRRGRKSLGSPDAERTGPTG